MIDPRTIEGIREVAQLLEGKVAGTWLLRTADEIERNNKPRIENRERALERLANRDLGPEPDLGPLLGAGGYITNTSLRRAA